MGPMTTCIALLIMMLVEPLHAQIVRGQVVDSVTQIPLAQAVVVLAAQDGAELARTLTDDEGRFLLRAADAGEFHLEVDAEEYRSSTFPSFALGATDMKAFMLLIAELRPPPNPVTAAEVIREICPSGTVKPGEGVLAGFVYEETRTPVVGAAVIGTWPVLYDAFAGLVDSVDLGRLRNVWSTDSAGMYAVCGIPAETEVVFHAGAGPLLSDFHTVRFGDRSALVDGTLHPIEQPLVRHDFRLLSPARRTAAVRGVIVDGAKEPMAGVIVELVETDLQTTTDTSGAFSLTQLPAGTVQLTARQAGFRPVTRDIKLTHGDTVRFAPKTLVLKVSPVELNPVVVESERPSTRRSLADFWERRKHGSGNFITREEFEKQGDPQETTDVLRRMGGILITPNPNIGFPDEPWYWILIQRTRGPRSFELRTGPCFPIYFLDRHYVGNSGRVDINREVPISQIEAVEVYSGLTVPREFIRQGYECGVIVFWTR